MADHAVPAGKSLDGAIFNTIGHPILVAIGAFLGHALGWAGPLSSSLNTLLTVIGGVCGLVFSIMYRRYLGVVASGSKRKGTPERKDYDALRDCLSRGGFIAPLYAHWLTAFLDGVDRLFGDVGAEQRAFGLKKPAPLWTGPAFHACVCLALVYPIITILLFWAVSGHVGPAEAAFGLSPQSPGWKRAAVVVAVVPLFFLPKLFDNATVFRIAIGVAIFSALLLVVLIGLSNGKPLMFVPICYAFIFIGTRPFAGIPAVFCPAYVALGSYAEDLLESLSLDAASAGTVIVSFVFVVMLVVIPRFLLRSQSRFLSLFLVGMIVGCLCVARFLSPWKPWESAGPVLLFVCLLTLINAPFDWASLGLTRALLRRGLELGGWWPLVLAVLDAALAAVIIVFLALTMIVGVQAFDDLAAIGGGHGARILPLSPFFDGMSAHPTAPEHWWIYALLLSTMIPGMINLMIGGASLARGIPGLPYILLKKMPEAKAVPTYDRHWLALVLALQIVGGGLLGLVAQLSLAIGLFVYVMPFFGFELLDMARAVADYDLPARIIASSPPHFW
jgi:hypothetical protein